MKTKDIVLIAWKAVTAILAVPYAITTLILRYWFGVTEVCCGSKGAVKDNLSAWASDLEDLVCGIF